MAFCRFRIQKNFSTILSCRTSSTLLQLLMFSIQRRNRRQTLWKRPRRTSTLCPECLAHGGASPCFGSICSGVVRVWRSNKWSVWSGSFDRRCCRCVSTTWRPPKVWTALTFGCWRWAVAPHPLPQSGIIPLPRIPGQRKIRWAFRGPPSPCGNAAGWWMPLKSCVPKSPEPTKVPALTSLVRFS